MSLGIGVLIQAFNKSKNKNKISPYPVHLVHERQFTPTFLHGDTMHVFRLN